MADDYEKDLACPKSQRRTWWLPWNMILGFQISKGFRVRLLDAGEWLLDVFSRVLRPLRDNMCSLRTKKLE